MDTDATALENALTVLRQDYGERLAGPLQAGEARMRHTLEQRMNLDELTADRVVKKLSQTGRLAYVGSVDSGTEPGTSTTGPVISMPNHPDCGRRVPAPHYRFSRYAHGPGE